MKEAQILDYVPGEGKETWQAMRDVRAGVEAGAILGRITAESQGLWAPCTVGGAHHRPFIQRDPSKAPDTFPVDLGLSS